MQPCVSVSALNEQIKSLLESTFVHVRVEGEVSRPTYHSSGHLYFSLKDDKASVSCVMFRGNNQRLKFRVEEGMHLVIWGSVSVYAPRGSYQINCVGAEPSGSGALALAYEQLKKSLQAKGYFDETRKKALPPFPAHIALVTSASGAALQDMKHVASRRWPLVRLELFEALVQGEGATGSIVKALRRADSSGAQIIVLARGGGSVEDLWAFNEEAVAEAVFTCNTPIISAIGHEIDYVISDFVADKRAPTPSAAMELALPDCNEMRMTLDALEGQFRQRFLTHLQRKEHQLTHVQENLKRHSLDAKLAHMRQEIMACGQAMHAAFGHHVQRWEFSHQALQEALHVKISRVLAAKEAALSALQATYAAKAPQSEVKFGWAQVVQAGKPVRPEGLTPGEAFELQTPTHVIAAEVVTKRTL
jgi:exodeoxyribonuclease VII large subunit